MNRKAQATGGTETPSDPNSVEDKKSKELLKANLWTPLLVIAIVFGILFGLVATGQGNPNAIFMNSAFFTVILTILYTVFALMNATFKPASDVDKNLNYYLVIYKVGRIFALAAFVLVNGWIMFASSFSFFGGSVYGGIMQVIIMLPLIFLLINFWVSGSVPGLFILGVASCMLFPLSFSFPTLFSNFYALSTGSSAAAGGAVMSNFAVVDPMSYYKSSILKQGTTEIIIGPTYEEVTDDVVGVQVSVGGRMCDDTDLVATVRLDNEAKYKLSNVYVQLSPVRDPYRQITGGVLGFDVCGTRFNGQSGFGVEDFSSNYFEVMIADLPKGAPSTVTAAFTTHLNPDVLTQYCSIRTDVVLSYHSTSVFPLTFVDYDSYLIDPANIGTPTSISSFGKMRIDIGVGQQPIPVKEATKELESYLLKVGWAKKGDGLVNNPEIYLFLPGDLGVCNETSLSEYIKGNTFNIESYRGSVADESRFEASDFTCFSNREVTAFCNNNNAAEAESFCDNNPNNVMCKKDSMGGYLYSYNTVCSFSNPICDHLLKISDTVTVSELEADPLKAVSGFIAKNIDSLNVPGIDNVCEDLVGDKDYNLCKANFNPTSSDVMFCTLLLNNINVTKVDMNTYLVRADSIYEFHDVSTTNFQIENCDAI